MTVKYDTIPLVAAIETNLTQDIRVYYAWKFPRHFHVFISAHIQVDYWRKSGVPFHVFISTWITGVKVVDPPVHQISTRYPRGYLGVCPLGLMYSDITKICCQTQ